MFHQSFRRESLHTEITMIRFLPRMAALVCVECLFLCESLAAHLTHVRPMSRVYPHVFSEGVVPFESFAAYGTHSRTLSGVCPHVKTQMFLRAHLPVANFTLKLDAQVNRVRMIPGNKHSSPCFRLSSLFPPLTNLIYIRAVFRRGSGGFFITVGWTPKVWKHLSPDASLFAPPPPSIICQIRA